MRAEGRAEERAGEQELWAKGDYARIAPRMQPIADAVVAALQPWPGARVLDVAAGSGNATVAAARAGASVVATDLVPAMVATGRARCESLGLAVEWREADALELPFPDLSFDAVMSSLGVMLVPHPHVAAAELFRMVPSGGRVAVAAWARDGFNDHVSQVVRPFWPERTDTPTLANWGDEVTVAGLLAPWATTIRHVHGSYRVTAMSVEAWVAEVIADAPPLAVLRETLSEPDRAKLAAAVDDVARRFAAEYPDGVTVELSYLVTTAEKR
ncbi:MAG: methyltransferase domain-containing protein [Actinomycetota bacterium]|nr:methyltransferase domain-containing protein [Actinomycetota bacterium]